MFPELVRVGPFTLYSFGLLVVLGFAAAAWLAARLARERGFPGDALLDGAALMLIGGIAGARLVFVLLNWETYRHDILSMAQTWRGGMSFHGGLAGGILAGVVYLRLRRLPLLPFADAAAPALALGYAVGRIGCFLNGCCYGTATSGPWGVHFPHSAPGELQHPVQLYATVINLALCALLVAAYRRPHREGQIMALYIAGYSLYRFLVEILRRGVTADVLPIGLTEAQLFSLFALAASSAWWVWLARRGRDVGKTAVSEVSAPAAA